MTKTTTAEFDKYYFYNESVQSADVDVEFFRDAFKELKGKNADRFREDFCGTFALSCEWVKMRSENTAIGIDLDPEPIEYGTKNYLTQLTDEEQSRVKIQEDDVLSKGLPKAQIIAACNFSYFIFKKRELLKAYLKNCLDGLEDGGIFVMDCFGGSECFEPNEEETEHKGFSYFWDQDSYDPITNEAQFFIHFKPKGMKKQREAFSYDWRMWSIPELRDLLEEVGFAKTHVYWEGTDDDGEGDGEFKRVEHGEDCESWVAYLVSEK